MIWKSSGIFYSASDKSELSHAGVKGMRWGIRKYQNPDGTLTEEGKRRYGIGEGRRSGDIVRKGPDNKTEVWKKSDAEKLSDEELNRRNNRLQREQQYKNSVTTDSERNRQQLANEIKKDIIKKVLIGGAVALAAVAMKKNWQTAANFIGKHGKKAFSTLKNRSRILSLSKNYNELNITSRAANSWKKWRGQSSREPRMFDTNRWRVQAAMNNYNRIRPFVARKTK